MRSPSQPHSALRSPLNHLLGTEVNMRILRLLAMSAVPMSKAEIARRTHLNTSGVGRSIEALGDLAILESLGTGSRRLHRLRIAHPMAKPLIALFMAEHECFESLIESLRAATFRIQPPPRAVWVQGSVAQETDAPGEPLIVCLLASSRDVGRCVDRMRGEVGILEIDHDITISIQGLTSADLATLAPSDRLKLEYTIALMGPSPLALMPDDEVVRRGRSASSHQELDQRSLAMAGVIALKLKDDPSLVDQALQYLNKRIRQASPGERKEHEEWDRILRTMPLTRLLKLLVDPSERATRLRQSMPFPGVLSRDERDGLLDHDHDET